MSRLDQGVFAVNRGKIHPSDRPAGQRLLGRPIGEPGWRAPSARIVLLSLATLVVTLVVVGLLTDWSVSGMSLSAAALVVLSALALLIRRPPATHLEMREKNRTRRTQW